MVSAFKLLGLLALGWVLCQPTLAIELEPYPGARPVFKSEGQVDDYVLALGSYRKIDNNWQADREERLKGVLSRITLELPEGHSARNGFDFYLDQIKTSNSRELFHCKGRDCGTSNSWANNHFKILQLYGLDQYQQYSAYEITEQDRPVYVALYAVQRGNKRVYVQLDVLRADKVVELGVASSPVSLIRSLQKEGYYVFPDLIAADSRQRTRVIIKPAHVKVLADVLRSNPRWKLALVGHDYSPVDLAVQQTRSLEYAKQVKQALLDAGVEDERLTTFGLGSLSPAGRGDRIARVEVVKLE